MTKEYLLIDGKVKLSNTEVTLDNSVLSIIKEKIAPLILVVLLASKIFELIQKINQEAKIALWIFLFVFCFFIIICIYWLYNSWIKIPWKQKFSVQDIVKLTKEAQESETTLIVSFNNGQKIVLTFRTNETYLKDFIRDLEQKTSFEITADERI